MGFGTKMAPAITPCGACNRPVIDLFKKGLLLVCVTCKYGADDLHPVRDHANMPKTAAKPTLDVLDRIHR